MKVKEDKERCYRRMRSSTSSGKEETEERCNYRREILVSHYVSSRITLVFRCILVVITNSNMLLAAVRSL